MVTKLKKTQIVTKLENSYIDKTKKKIKAWQNLSYDKSQFMKKKKTLKGYFSKNISLQCQGHLTISSV